MSRWAAFEAGAQPHESHATAEECDGESDEDDVFKATIAEISAMRELKHPNIVSLTYASIKDNILYLLYEFFPIDLKKYMDNLPHGQLLETQLVKNYLHQITQGIYFLTVYK